MIQRPASLHCDDWEKDPVSETQFKHLFSPVPILAYTPPMNLISLTTDFGSEDAVGDTGESSGDDPAVDMGGLNVTFADPE